MNIRDLAWLAGLLEGEGTFVMARRHTGRGRSQAYPAVRVAMTDEDTVRRAAEVAGVGRVYGPYPPRPPKGLKDWWALHVQRQADAAGLMMTLYPFLCSRRQAKVREILLEWRTGARP